MSMISYRFTREESTAPAPEATAVFFDGDPVPFKANGLAQIKVDREPPGTKRRVYLYVAGNRGSSIDLTIERDGPAWITVYSRKLRVGNDPDVDAAEYFLEA